MGKFLRFDIKGKSVSVINFVGKIFMTPLKSKFIGKELLITPYLTLYNLNTTASIVIIGLSMI